MNRMLRSLVVGLLLGSSAVVLGQAVKNLKLLVNNQPSSTPAIVVNGKTYVPLEVLKGLGVTSSIKGDTVSLAAGTAGGASQLGAVEGCMNEWLFNGLLRVRVLGIERLETIPTWEFMKGWAIKTEVRNGTADRAEPSEMGLTTATLAMPDGSVKAHDDTGKQISDFQTFQLTPLLPGASITHSIKFRDEQSEIQPAKLVLQVDPKRVQAKIKGKFNVTDPSFRVKLDCSK